MAQHARERARVRACLPKRLLQLVLAARCGDDVAALPLDALRQRLVRGRVAGVQGDHHVNMGELRIRCRTADVECRKLRRGKLHPIRDVQLLGHLLGGSNHVLPPIHADHPHRRKLQRLREEKVERQGQIRLPASAVHYGERFSFSLSTFTFHHVLDHFQKLVHLVVLAAHRGTYLPVAVGEADHAQERGGVEGHEGRLLHAVVRQHLGRTVHLCRARGHHVALARHAHVKIALRGDEMEVARALLRDDLLQPLGGAVRVEVLHARLAVVDHLRLEPTFAADQDGPHRDAKRRAVAPHRLHNLHETLAEHARADFLCQFAVKFATFHLASSCSGCRNRADCIKLAARRAIMYGIIFSSRRDSS